MESYAPIPQTGTKRSNRFVIIGWLNFIDVLIWTIVIISYVLIAVFTSLSWWMFLILLLPFGALGFFMTYPIYQGLKLYDMFIDWFRYFVSKKSFNNNEIKNMLDPIISIKDNHITYSSVNGVIKSKKVLTVYEINPINIQLVNESEMNSRLEGLSKLFVNTSGQRFSLFKTEWEYDFLNRVDHFENLRNSNEIGSVKDLTIQDEIVTYSKLNDSTFASQKKYFLILNGANETINIKTYSFIKKDMNQAGLFLSTPSDETMKKLSNKILPININSEKNKIEFKSKYYKINDIFYKTISFNQLPIVASPMWNAKLFNFSNTNALMSFDFIPVDKIPKYVEKIKVTGESKKAKSLVEQYGIENNISSIHDLASKIGTSTEALKRVKYLITIKASDYKALNRKYHEIRQEANGLKMKVHNLNYLQWEAFAASWPTNNKSLTKDIELNCGSTALALSYPYLINDYIDKDGDYYGFSFSGTPNLIDFTKISESINSWSTLILGKTGSGKSTTAKKMIKEHYLNNRFRKIFIIDPSIDSEYTTLVKNLNGDVIDMAGLRPNSARINPFEVFGATKNMSDEQNIELYTGHIRSLETMFQTIFLNELKSDQIATLNSYVIKTYDSKKINQESKFYRLKSQDYPIFDDLLKVIKKDIEKFQKSKDLYLNPNDLLKLHNVVSQYAKNGIFQNLWNGYTNVDINNRLICFNITKLATNSTPSRIRVAQMFLLLKFIEQQTILNAQFNKDEGLDEKNASHIVVFVDEFHLLIDKNNLGPIQFFYHLIKQIRHTPGHLVPITQNVNDLTADLSILKETTGIINACQFIFVHKFLANDINNLDKLFEPIGGLTTNEKAFLQQDGHGEAIFISGNKNRIPMQVSYEEFEKKLFKVDLSFLNDPAKRTKAYLQINKNE